MMQLLAQCMQGMNDLASAVQHMQQQMQQVEQQSQQSVQQFAQFQAETQAKQAEIERLLKQVMSQPAPMEGMGGGADPSQGGGMDAGQSMDPMSQVAGNPSGMGAGGQGMM